MQLRPLQTLLVREESSLLQLQVVFVASSPMDDFVRWYDPVCRRYHQPRQLFRSKNTRDVSCLADICRIDSNNQAVFTTLNRNFLR